jgi:hypothetical protein
MSVLVPQVDVASGEISPNGAELGPGDQFQWVNNSSAQVTLTDCGVWCTADSYTVPAATDDGPGITAAQVRANPNINAFALTDPAWDAPGMPHIIVTTVARPKEQREKEVA